MSETTLSAEVEAALDEKWVRDSFHHLRKAVGVFLRPASDGTADWVLRELSELERRFATLRTALERSARIEAAAVDAFAVMEGCPFCTNARETDDLLAALDREDG
jgi:hypothetical protein